MRIITWIVSILLIVLGMTFAMLNAEPISLHYYLGTHTLPFSLWLICALGLGLLVGLIVMSIPYFQIKNECRRLRRQLKAQNN